MNLSHIAWFKSSYSDENTNCVEVAHLYGPVALRDSQYPDRGQLTLDPLTWTAFLAAVRAEEF